MEKYYSTFLKVAKSFVADFKIAKIAKATLLAEPLPEKKKP